MVCDGVLLHTKTVARVGIGRFEIGLLGPSAACPREDMDGPRTRAPTVGLIAIHTGGATGFIGSDPGYES